MSVTEGILREVEDIGWEARLAQRTLRLKSSIIRELLKYAIQPDIISFAGGMPAPELFPVREFDEACRYVLANESQIALQYSPTEGHVPLKEWLAETMSKYSIWVEPEKSAPKGGIARTAPTESFPFEKGIPPTHRRETPPASARGISPKP